MNSFWLLVIAMLVLAILLVIWPLLNNKSRDKIDRRQLNIKLLQQQYQQLEADLANGVIDQEIYASSKSDLEAAVLADTLTPEVTTEKASGKLGYLAIALMAFIPISTVLLYQQYGNPNSLTPQATSTPNQADIEAMVAGLASRLESEPDNIEGWTMLGKSYMMMRRFSDAQAVFKRLLDRSPDDTNLLLNYADATAMNAGGVFSGEPYQIIQNILELDPQHIQARWMAGMAEQQLGNVDQALAIWQPLLLDLQQISPEMSAELQRMIASISESPAQVATDSEVDQKQLKINVVIGQEIAAQIQAGDTLFVYARAMQGPPMPLAIQRLSANDIPEEIILDDSTAMMPQMQLSNFPIVMVDARISATGSATPQAGDFYGRIENIAVEAGSETHSITIDQLVE